MITIREKDMGMAGLGIMFDIRRDSDDGWTQWIGDRLIRDLGPVYAAEIIRQRFEQRGFGDETDWHNVYAACEARYRTLTKDCCGDYSQWINSH